MKNRLLATVSFVAFVSCSAPKYTYFDYSARNVNSGKTYEMSAEKRKDKIAADRAIYSEVLVASNSKRIVLANGLASKASLPTKSRRPAPTSSRWSMAGRSTTKSGDVNSLQEIRKIKKEPTEPVKEKSKYKNAFAIAGFIMVFVPIILLVAGISTSLDLAILMVSLASVIVLSALGLRSKKRGFALAGLILGIIEAVLLVAFAIAFYAGFHDGNKI
jgi:hypothetical protein